MFLTEIAALALMAQAPIVVTGESGVGFDALMDGENAAAIAEIEANKALDAEDPARLINLGVAYARQGHTVKARELFQAAMQGEERLTLETSEGAWKDSRHLAKLALEKLDRGEFGGQRFATR